MNRPTGPEVVEAISAAAEIDITELLAALEPVRDALATAREDVTEALTLAGSADSYNREVRYAELRKARARRDAFKRVIFAVEHLASRLHEGDGPPAPKPDYIAQAVAAIDAATVRRARGGLR
ncbi:MAG: hypothetical protein HY829_10580 [Actinobacteria bacterium]|nr:hypothetical protein [Actinomycetota bacterium]